VDVTLDSNPHHYFAAHVSAGTVTATFPLPMAPIVVNGSNGLPINFPMVLGENGTAFVSYGANVASFNLNSGTLNWNYPNGQGVNSMFYANGGGLTLIAGQSNQIPVDASGNAGTSVALSPFSLLQPNWFGDWQGAMASSNIGLAGVVAPQMDWGHSTSVTDSGSPSKNGASIEMSWFPVLPNCTGTEKPCIYNAVDDLVVRLTDPTISGLAQTNIFNKLGNDSNGNPLRTAGFIAYLRNNRPRIYDGLRSTYCSEILDNTFPSIPEFLCFRKAFLRYTLNLLSTDVKDKFTSESTALTQTPGKPLLTFVRPQSVGPSTAGKNLGNEALIFHEALHGLTGLQDFQFLDKLGMNSASHASCSTTVRIQKSVLSHSTGLDPAVVWITVISCPLQGDE
jgi:hypothetical protein